MQTVTTANAKTQTTSAGRRAEIISYDPATGEEVGRARIFSTEEVRDAVTRAREAQKSWRTFSFRERGKIILRTRELTLQTMEELALLISRETGKPVAEAIPMEITPTLDLMQFFARKTQKLLRPEKLDIGHYKFLARTSRLEYHPVGVVGIISPWNFPWAIPLGETVMALMAGNAVVLKPSELTPLTGLKIGEIFARAGLPKDLLTVVTGDGATGAALAEAGVDKIMFTGSVATGKRVLAAAAKTLTPVVLELGGKDPMIVLEDADIEQAARGAVWSAFSNSGQACASVERCYVHESVAQKFTERVTAITRDLRQNIGTCEDTEIGSMSSQNQRAIVEDHLREAIKSGAKVLTGGARPSEFPNGAFHQPTVLTNVNHDMAIMRDETFGPVLPIMTFNTQDEAVKLANDSPFGLTASVWSKNIKRASGIARRIEAGTVTINEHLYTHGIAQTPWGGVKQSGMGRTHGRSGLLEMVTPQHIHINRVTRIPDVWWFNYTPNATRLFRALAGHFTTGRLLDTFALAPAFLRRLFERGK
ncbi:MAG: aldehyde dehydrogenase family protein [Pyrinomonadaceae bacterium]